MTDLFENGEAQATTPTQEPLKLRTVLAEIAEHACEPGFSAMAIAEKYGVTEREVRRLLKKTGKSFSDHKLRRRLERARCSAILPPRISPCRISPCASASAIPRVSTPAIAGGSAWRRRRRGGRTGLEPPRATRQAPPALARAALQALPPAFQRRAFGRNESRDSPGEFGPFGQIVRRDAGHDGRLRRHSDPEGVA